VIHPRVFPGINSIRQILTGHRPETLAHSDGRGQGEGGLNFPPTAPFPQPMSFGVKFPGGA